MASNMESTKRPVTREEKNLWVTNHQEKLVGVVVSEAQFLDRLFSMDVINRETYSDILAERTRFARMRKVFIALDPSEYYLLHDFVVEVHPWTYKEMICDKRSKTNTSNATGGGPVRRARGQAPVEPPYPKPPVIKAPAPAPAAPTPVIRAPAPAAPAAPAPAAPTPVIKAPTPAPAAPAPAAATHSIPGETADPWPIALVLPLLKEENWSRGELLTVGGALRRDGFLDKFLTPRLGDILEPDDVMEVVTFVAKHSAMSSEMVANIGAEKTEYSKLRLFLSYLTTTVTRTLAFMGFLALCEPYRRIWFTIEAIINKRPLPR
ncbi:ORF7 [Silurid herpesvirus 1]|nr:ORF7 [Silurid herpesvirus 1]AVP72257.1 ORF7 [Silurid herpesvirus 1]